MRFLYFLSPFGYFFNPRQEELWLQNIDKIWWRLTCCNRTVSFAQSEFSWLLLPLNKEWHITCFCLCLIKLSITQLKITINLMRLLTTNLFQQETLRDIYLCMLRLCCKLMVNAGAVQVYSALDYSNKREEIKRSHFFT